MQVVDGGEYLGVYLGVGGCEKTSDACEEKFLSRCFDLSLSVAQVCRRSLGIVGEASMLSVMYRKS